MSLIIATGSNLGDRGDNLWRAQQLLSERFDFIAASRIYRSSAVDYLGQPEFYNQVLEFRPPLTPPDEVMSILLQIEDEMGRVRNIPKGPRVIDLDILFIGPAPYSGTLVEIPHPRLFSRSFVVCPLRELPYFSILREYYCFDDSFSNTATPI